MYRFKNDVLPYPPAYPPAYFSAHQYQTLPQPPRLLMVVQRPVIVWQPMPPQQPGFWTLFFQEFVKTLGSELAKYAAEQLTARSRPASIASTPLMIPPARKHRKARLTPKKNTRIVRTVRRPDLRLFP